MDGAQSRLDAEARKKMHSLMERFSMPAHLARQVAAGERGLSDALVDMQRADAAERLLKEGRIDDQGAGLLRQGRLTPEEAELRKRLRDHKSHQGYTESRVDGLLECDVVIAVLGGGLHRGRLVEAGAYELVVETTDGAVTLQKHDLKLAFLGTHRKRLLKRGITWGAEEARLEAGALRHWVNRRDLKARDIFKAMEGGAVITWTTAEGDQLRGRITGFNRFEVILETSQGAEAILLRHAFGSMDLRSPGG